jgi:hypothetical protein
MNEFQRSEEIFLAAMYADFEQTTISLKNLKIFMSVDDADHFVVKNKGYRRINQQVFYTVCSTCKHRETDHWANGCTGCSCEGFTK